MTQTHIPDTAEISPVRSAQQACNPLVTIGAVTFIAIVSLLGATIAMASATGFSFGNLAAAEAGENPPREVSLRIAQLMMWQAYANALLTGIALSMLLFIASCSLNALHRKLTHKNYLKLVRSFFIAISIGSSCLFLACLAFRMQQVGAQDLVITAAIHASLWGGLGFIVADSMVRQLLLGWKIPLSAIAGLFWGTIFPTLSVLIYPDVYVERLFATDGLVGLWAGGGCAVLLLAGLVDEKRRQQIPPSTAESGAAQ